jgi:hypothetical protein
MVGTRELGFIHVCIATDTSLLQVLYSTDPSCTNKRTDMVSIPLAPDTGSLRAGAYKPTTSRAAGGVRYEGANLDA